MTVHQQLQLPANTYPCPSCAGKGTHEHQDSGERRYCRTCHGTGQVDYDPHDHSEIPY